MRQVEFLISLPKEPTPDDRIARVVDPASVSSKYASIWHSQQTRVFDGMASGMILGHVFSRGTFRPVNAEADFAFQCRDPGIIAQMMIDRFWGAYVLVCYDIQKGLWRVMPDPSGLLPVYRHMRQNAVLLATDPSLFEQCMGNPLRVSYSKLTSHLERTELRQNVTCLENIDELVPGALSTVGTAEPVKPLWNAPALARHQSPRSFCEHAEELRHLCTQTIGSWAGLFGPTLVATSGGVDSSLICAAASASGHNIGCVSLATIDPSGDERSYARAVAEACGASFAERIYDPDLFDPRWSASAGLPRPARRAFLHVLDCLLSDALAEQRGEVVFDGNGGDNIFCYLHSSAPLVDRLRSEGVGLGVLKTLFDMCRITGCSIPTMLRAVVRRLSTRTDGVWAADQSFLCARSDPSEADALTQWLPEAGQKRTGWRDHLQLIMHAQHHIHGASTHLQRFSPLASQPIVEFCLAVPTWHWTRGGHNRALARAAFEDILPSTILKRTSKAGPDSLSRAAFLRNRASISSRLLGGQLAAHGVIDRKAVNEALQADPHHQSTPVGRLLDLLEAENWARSWAR